VGTSEAENVMEAVILGLIMVVRVFEAIRNLLADWRLVVAIRKCGGDIIGEVQSLTF
jgi:hypothetical protein